MRESGVQAMENTSSRSQLFAAKLLSLRAGRTSQQGHTWVAGGSTAQPFLAPAHIDRLLRRRLALRAPTPKGA